MKIYLASGDIHTHGLVLRRLLSFYDLHISTIPLRNETFKLILKDHEKDKEDKNKATGRL